MTSFDRFAAALTAHRLWRTTQGHQGARLTTHTLEPSQLALDLTEADLQGVCLQGAQAHGLRLARSDLRGADLRDAAVDGDLRGADLRGADLRGAVLAGLDLRGADLRDADLRGADVFCALLDGAELVGAQLEGVHLGAVIYEATMRDLQGRAVATGSAAWFLEAVRGGHLEPGPLSPDGSGPAAALLRAVPPGATPAEHPAAALIETWLTPVPPPSWEDLLTLHQTWLDSHGRAGQRLTTPAIDLRGRSLAGLDLRGATLLCARAQGVDLRGACLDDALLLEVGLSGADLRDVRARRAHLRGANLAGARIAIDARGADLREIDLQAAVIDRFAVAGAQLTGTELREANTEALQAGWTTALAHDPPNARVVLRALQGGVPGAGLASILAAEAPEVGELIEALEPGDMAMAQPLARLLADWTLQFIALGGTAGQRPPTLSIDQPEVGARLLAHAEWLDSDGAAGARLSLAGLTARGLALPGADLRGADLAGADLSGSILDGADCRGADCRGADLRGCRLDGLRFDDALLDGARLSGSSFVGGRLRGARIVGVSFESALMPGIDLTDADLAQASFRGAMMPDAQLIDGRFTDCDWRGAVLTGAQLTRARFTGPWVFGFSLLAADLQPIETAFRALHDAPALTTALRHALRQPPPRRTLAGLLDTVELDPDQVAILRPWLVVLSAIDDAEVEALVGPALSWLGLSPLSSGPEVAPPDPHQGHHH